jgi:hypothetical protein
MPRFFLQLFQSYGLDVVQIVLIIYLFWKLFANHLRHITDRLENNIRETKCVKKEVIDLKERVSHIEGKLESPIQKDKSTQ